MSLNASVPPLHLWQTVEATKLTLLIFRFQDGTARDQPRDFWKLRPWGSLMLICDFNTNFQLVDTILLRPAKHGWC